MLAPNAKLRALVVPQEPEAPAQAVPPAHVRDELCSPPPGAAELGPATQARV
ncbi:MAG: hypothetical protein JF606_22970 [Burkholderiales bacterium]|nr:hypothetical protein [Burkholderiales bacterium]